MTKTLLAFVCAAAAWAGAEAQTSSMTFSYAQEVQSAYSLGLSKNAELSLAFEVTEDMATALAGNDITAVNITTGTYKIMNQQTNNIRNITIFITTDLDAEPAYTQEAKLGTGAYTQYTIDLDTPYNIAAGKPVYVGYTFKITDAPANNRLYYMPVDGVPTSDPSCFYGYVGSNGKKIWSNDAAEIGSICMGCVISGASLPQNGALVKSFTLPEGVQPGKAAAATLAVTGFGATPVSSIEVAYTLGNEAPVTVPVTFATPVNFCKQGSVTIPGVTYPAEQLGITAKVEVVKVNGQTPSIPSSGQTTFNCFDQAKGYARMHLIEEGTGTWCGWCPRGIVMMEAAAKNYPDLFARVALHYNDELQNSSSVAVINGLNIPGFPDMYIDRTVEDDPGYYTSLFPAYAANKLTTYAGFTDLRASTANGKITISSTLTSVADFNNAADRLRIAYYLVEDGLGPYGQTNNYAGGANGACGGWERKFNPQSTIYDDVCVYCAGGFSGFANSLPAEIKAGQANEHSATASSTLVSGKKFRVIAILIDNLTGGIVNAAQIEADKEESAINEIEAVEPVSVVYHDLSGRRVDQPAAGRLYIRTTRYSNGTTKSEKLLK